MTGAQQTVKAEARFVHTAPRKVRLVVDQIRGRSVPEARTILRFLVRDAARDVEKVLGSAVANAEANHGLVGDDLVVAEAQVGEGPTLKRIRPRARGRAYRILKRTSHIRIELRLPGGEPLPAPRKPIAPVSPPAPAPESEEPRAAAVLEASTTSTEATEDKPVPKRRARPKKSESAEGE